MGGGTTWRRELGAFTELFALSGLAFAQPFFDVLSKNTDVLVAREASPRDVLIMTALVLFVPTVLWYALELASSLISDRLRRVVHLVGVGMFAAVLLAIWVKQVPDTGPGAIVALGILGGLATAWAVTRSSAVRRWLRLLAIAPILFALIFLASSPATPVVFGDRNAALVRAPVAHPHRVVWIVLDEFPETSLLDGTGRVDATLFPNFAALAATSNWYRNSTTIAPFTRVAVPGMLSGTMPDGDVAATVANYPQSVFTLLGGTYRINAFERLTAMCPSRACRDSRHPTVRANSLGGLIRDSLDLWGDFASPERTKPGLDAMRGVLSFDPNPMGTAKAFVSTLAPATTPTFDFLHVLLPHWSWRYIGTTQDNGAIGSPPGLAADRWTSAWAADAGRERHLLQVQATDTVLGMIMQRLRSIGAWDDTMFVVTADHGVGFAAHEPARGLGATNAADVVWTPLFIKLPGQVTGKVDDRPARTLDILPTIADVVGITSPWKMQGRSLLGRPRRNGPVRVMHWKIDALEPDGAFNIVDTDAGFRRVLAARASDATGDPRLRLYRVGPFRDLVGRRLDTIERAAGAGPTIAMTDPARFDNVNPAAPVAPWLVVNGTVTRTAGGTPLAVSVNGVIAAVTQSVKTPGALSPWWASLPPQLFVPGHNDVEVFEIAGTASAPTLRKAPG
jgi:hypothetical protein